MEYYEAIRHIRNMTLEGKDKEAIDLLLEEISNRPSLSEIDNMSWEIGVLLGDYNRSKKDNKQELYTKAIQYTVKNKYGIVFHIDDFIESVDCGGFIDYDGIGYALDIDGKEIEQIHCNTKYLKSIKKKGAMFVAWYNK